MPWKRGSTPSRRNHLVAWLCFAVLGVALGLSVLRLVLRQRAVETEVWTSCRDQAKESALAVESRLKALEAVTHGLVLDLEQGKVTPQDLPAHLQEALRAAPGSAWRLGALFQPDAAGQGSHLWSPFVEREAAGIRPLNAYDALPDYTRSPWYLENLKAAAWSEPLRDHATGHLLVDFAEPFRLPGAKAPSGVVRMDVSLQEIQDLVGALSLGSSGYGLSYPARGCSWRTPWMPTSGTATPSRTSPGR